ncbi:aspartate dehydrogenase [Actinomadura pelletieri DSM 43383]|uniref:L-aspartate dehydrogenase n=1 Tax=Actinomadura pelletieri DSM 43383 TaxID=1120940 RepID=A0A495QSM9_9ACTN|nr:aspartate dehydrogenase domain-containing protein [Actinomadura pelletieri]RKS76510.1 aspartate dehydrogenase [Actinomadura pelletieri DSM 43383]
MSTTRHDAPARVAVIGGGAIGSAVLAALREGRLPGAEPVAVVDGRSFPEAGVPQVDLATALDRADVVVECAGQAVVARSAADILDHGVDLLVTSVGALCDPEVADAVAAAGPGRLLLTSGAAGGLDILAAAAAQAPLTRVAVTTAKLPATLVQPWMDEPSAARLHGTDRPLEVFAGGAREAARLFPRSLNLAATVGWAVGDLDLVEVRLVADPAASLTRHVIEAGGPGGVYRFEIQNVPSPENPRTSGVVPYAVLRSLAALVGRPSGVI